MSTATAATSIWIPTETSGRSITETNTPPFEPSIHLRRYFFQGFDSFGAPMYDFNHMAIYSVSRRFPRTVDRFQAPFFKPEDSKGGTLYVSANGVPQESALQSNRPL
jgi:hypothetical protein